MVAASLFEIMPLFLIQSNIPTIASVQPYTPLELMGRDMYIAERLLQLPLADDPADPGRDEALRRIQQAGRIGVRPSVPMGLAADRARTWPARAASSRPTGTCVHFQDPRQMTPGSIMPELRLAAGRTGRFRRHPAADGGMRHAGRALQRRARSTAAVETARKQAGEIAAKIAADKGPAGLEDKEVVALIAYLDRLGSDLFAPLDRAADDDR